MLFLVGFPQSVYADVLKSLISALQSELITGLPAGNHSFDKAKYYEDCVDTLLGFYEGRKRCFDKGLAIIAFSQFDTKDVKKDRDNFFSFSIVHEVDIGQRIASSGRQLSRDKNELVRVTLLKAKRAIKVRNDITTYFKSRRNRTPFLLPIRHFGDNAVSTMLEDARRNLRDGQDSLSVLEQLAGTFEKTFAFTKNKGSSGYFVNKSKVHFKSPGRDLHGNSYPRSDGHKQGCFFNGILRIGGVVMEGFHYDCTLEGGKYGGSFLNCHNELVTKHGDPHLNVYPNDFIR